MSLLLFLKEWGLGLLGVKMLKKKRIQKFHKSDRYDSCKILQGLWIHLVTLYKQKQISIKFNEQNIKLKCKCNLPLHYSFYNIVQDSYAKVIHNFYEE